MKKSFYIALVSALLTAGLIQAAPAFAQDQVPGQAVVSLVHTADIDVSTADGRRQLDRRLSIAAREVCGTASDADLAGKNDVRACRAETLAQAKAQNSTIYAAANRGAVIAITASR
jgi:UrcA family protein